MCLNTSIIEGCYLEYSGNGVFKNSCKFVLLGKSVVQVKGGDWMKTER